MTMGIPNFIENNFIPRIPKEASVHQRQKQKTHFFSKGKDLGDDEEKDNQSFYTIETDSTGEDQFRLHRSLKGRHVQLLLIGATIGSLLFVTIGTALVQGGPLNLFLGFLIWSLPILFITMSTAEMVSHIPITSPFVRLSGRCCDKALEVTTGWNFWFLCCSQIPFEVTTVNSIIHYWRSDYSPAIPLAVQLVLYFLINLFGVSVYGEVEFFLSLGKVLLATGLIVFTFIVMVGGNPEHDVFGFRYWRDPGPMATYMNTGDLGRFQGFVACLIRACFTFSGPEYVASIASETINPRKTLPSAFKQVFIRLSVFFIGGALSVGILVAYNDPVLQETSGASSPGAGGSPYVIAMQNLNIKVLPDIINVLLVSAAFSAGNSYTYCSSRTLYGIAMDGYAPRILTATTKNGIPLYCMLISLCWAFISFLQLGSQASLVLDWIINLVTSCQLINFSILCLTYCFYYRALKAQKIDRNSLPFKSWGQPYFAIIGGISAFAMIFICSYQLFLNGGWDFKQFLFSYLFLFIDIGIFFGYKIFRKTKWRDPKEVDLVTGLKEVELHEEEISEVLAHKEELRRQNGGRRWYHRLQILILGSDL